MWRGGGGCGRHTPSERNERARTHVAKIREWSELRALVICRRICEHRLHKVGQLEGLAARSFAPQSGFLRSRC